MWSNSILLDYKESLPAKDRFGLLTKQLVNVHFLIKASIFPIMSMGVRIVRYCAKETDKFFRYFISLNIFPK